MSVKKAYKSWSKIYDHNENKTRDLDLIATQTVLKSIKFDTIVELGCGTGKNTTWFAPLTTKHIAVDFSSEMLAIAKEKVTALHVTFMEADISKPLSIPDSFADIVTCNLVLEHLQFMTPVFTEVTRMLKPNGYFFISEIHPMKRYVGSQAKFDEVLVESHLHHLSEYISESEKVGLRLIKVNEWFDEDKNKPPRLLTLLFQKNK